MQKHGFLLQYTVIAYETFALYERISVHFSSFSIRV